MSKPFSIDIKLVSELKKLKNPSKIVNDLLSDYIFGGSHLKEEELKIKLNKIKADKLRMTTQEKELNKQLEKIQTNEKKMTETCKDIPKEIIQDFKAFPDMTEEILWGRFKNIYKTKYEITYQELLKSFKQMKGGAK